MLRNTLLTVSTAILATCTSSCFAVTDLDRFEAKGTASGNFSDLRLTVRGMTSHVAELFEYRVVDANNTIQSRGFVIPLGGPEATLFVQQAVPKGDGFRLDFYADHDKSGTYNDGSVPGTKDHAWRLPLDKPNDDGAFVIDFQHNQVFSFLAVPEAARTFGTDAKIKLVNPGSLVGKRVEFRVSDAETKHVVGLYRVPVLPDIKQPLDVLVAGMIEEGVTYDLAVYTDDGKATPGSIKSFRIPKVVAKGGLTVDFDPATAPPATDVPSP
ncbi:MAG: hypothetical protein JST00_24290 [Deltaproteobacteria bacterium]|nr:hypothetical protein [Deltaproteobacteria bacterium]